MLWQSITSGEIVRQHIIGSGIDYILIGDYYIAAIELPADDDRPIGKWPGIWSGGHNGSDSGLWTASNRVEEIVQYKVPGLQWVDNIIRRYKQYVSCVLTGNSLY